MTLAFHLVLLLLLLSLVTLTVSESKNVIRKVGESVKLECAQLAPEGTFQTAMWYKQGVVVATVASTGVVDIPDPSLKARMSLSRQTLEINQLELGDSSDYRCNLYFIVEGSPKTSEKNYTLIVQDKPGPPGKPQYHDVKSQSVTITWGPSTVTNNSPVTVYVLHFSECVSSVEVDNFPVLVVENSTLMEEVVGLRPYTCYRVEASAVNSVGQSSFSPPSEDFFTKPEDFTGANLTTTTKQMLNDSTTTAVMSTVFILPPVGAPRFEATETNSTQVKIEWEPLTREETKGELQGYIISYETSKDDVNYLVVNDSKQTEALITGLTPYTDYTIRLKAKNSAGSGPEYAMTIRTDEGVPSQPRITHLSQRRSKSVVVHWEAPKQLNGQLIEYELRWTLDSPNGQITLPRHISGHFTDPMVATIDKLTPYTYYRVSVAAVTKGGRGPFSEEFPTLTDVVAPSVPLNLNVTKISSTSVQLRWERPLHVYRQIDGYLIKGWNSQGERISQWISGETTEYILSGLRRNSRYNVKVQGLTESVFNVDNFYKGQFTPVINFTLGA